MIYLVNGDPWADVLRAHSPEQGEVFVWRENFEFGPFQKPLGETEQATARARFFEERLGMPFDETKMMFVYQEQRLKRLARSSHLVLWLGTSRADQLLLLYILKQCRSLGITMVDLVTIPTGTLPQDSGELVVKRLFDERITLEKEDVIEAEEAWKDYIAVNPLDFVTRKEREIRLPQLHAAWNHHADYFPSQANGLSVIEELILTLIRRGISSFESLYHEVLNHRPEDGLTNVHLAAIVNELAEEWHPLIQIETSEIQGLEGDEEESWILTSLGQKVLAGDEDRIDVLGIDWWVGGVHLKENLWRRSSDGRLIYVES
ncbi:DUF1835 domain-containing protein [Marininema halotolerans]|uniref:DUF1835 domain-containing protein n=1 Tax=Marininema halotolerans TaxID=1155944 RepID=A0A1I6UG40_9BACL|nr:DUF1835 domain-containing protein [Marininema halotolerans]SFT00358.1 protein of unknown function [Marininema halotolerans]